MVSEAREGSMEPLLDRRNDRVLSVIDMLRAVWARRRLVAAVMTGGALVGALLTWVLPPVYEARTVVSPVTQESMGNVLSGLRSQLGGLAQLAGVDLGSLASEAKVTAYATLASDEFARDFIQANDLLPVLFSRQWDSENKRWENPRRAPTLNDGVRYFRKRIRFVSEDRRSGLVTLRIEWKEPQLAARWCNGMIDMVNERLRREAVAQSDESLVVLEKEVARTNSIELQQLLYRLMQSNINAKTVALVKREYAFKVIDRAYPADRDQMKRPRFAPMIALGLALGALLSIGYVILALALRDEVHA